MTKTCRQCKLTKDIYDFSRTRNSYYQSIFLSICKKCKSGNAREKRKNEKVIQVVLEQDPLEQADDAFKDDPNAVNEIQYGRVFRKPSIERSGGNGFD
tara:strand:- start:182 stop:475 length:294 start_codon:yes stop_codon:yes gene_type:complete